MKATFENSVDVLVKAYLNDTLERRNCYACAVGNLVAYACGYKFVEETEEFSPYMQKWEGMPYPAIDDNKNHINGWGAVFSTDFGVQVKKSENYVGEAKRQIDATGYSLSQLAKIEFAFEQEGRRGFSEVDRRFNGLLAVVDVLAEIHGVDLSVKENAIGRFAEIHATKV